MTTGAPPVDNTWRDDLYRSWVNKAIQGKDFASVSVAVWDNADQGGSTFTMQTGQATPKSSYEIGSITKVFTALLLALAVQRHDIPSIQLDTPVVDVLTSSSSSSSSSQGGKGNNTALEEELSLPNFPTQITLEQLSTHTSGLPRLPSDWNFYWNLFRHQSNPYSAYHESNLVTSLRKYRDKHPQEIGTHFAYSNFGVGLLGHALTKVLQSKTTTTTPFVDTIGAANTTTNASAVAYERLLEEYILEPLNLTNTSVKIPPGGSLLPGYDKKGNKVKHWTFDAMAGCGALHSTLSDLLQFGIVNLHAAQKHAQGQPMSTIERAMQLCHEPHFNISAKEWPKQPDEEEKDSFSTEIAIGLGWILDTNHTQDTTVIWHNGGTYGFSSYLGFEEKSGVIVVVLSNASKAVDATSLGQRIMQHALQHRSNGATEAALAVETSALVSLLAS